MVNKNEFENTLIRVRNDLGYKRGVVPVIQDIHERTGRIDVIVSDRPEKSLLLGPGGRVVANLSKIFGVPITIHSKIDLLSRSHRLSLTLKRIDELSDDTSRDQLKALEDIKRDVQVELKYPEKRVSPQREKRNIPIAVAFSGGVDSGAALYWADRVSESVTGLTVDLGPKVLGTKDKESIAQLCRELEFDHQFLDTITKSQKIFSKAINGRLHPCGRCHSVTMEALRKHVKSSDIDILITGEMLPTGRQSIELYGDTMVVHLPAALALSKYRTQIWSKRIGIYNKPTRFGCRLLAHCHEQGWKMSGPSIYRVLRETEAGILTTGQSLSQIKSILQSSLCPSTREESE